MQQETAVPAVVATHASEAHAHHEVVPFSKNNSKFAMWLFLASEVMFFTPLIAANVWARTVQPEEHALLNIPITSLNSFILLASSYFVARAIGAIRNGNVVKMQRSLVLNLVAGLVFFLIMMTEYVELSHHGITLNSGPFGFAFFTLTGFHGLHVLIGCTWLTIVLNKAINGVYTKDNYFGVEFYGLYWHFVDVVWIFIFTIVYLF